MLRKMFDLGVLDSLHDPKAERFGNKGWRFRWRADLLHAYVIEFKNEDAQIMFMLKYGT